MQAENAIVDSHPKGGDGTAPALLTSAVPAGQSPKGDCAMSTPAALRRMADALEKADESERRELGAILELLGREIRRGKITK